MVDESPPFERPWKRTRYRAPKADDSHVALPPLCEARDLARRNREALQGIDRCLQGRSLSQLRAWSRKEVFRAALEYTTEILGDAAPPAGSPADDPSMVEPLWYVGGHQPILFHPGVWVKNFVTSALAGADGIGLNLVVDNDTLTSTSIRVPAGTPAVPTVEMISFDEPRAAQPWEEARILDQDLFRTFPERVQGVLAEWKFKPLMGQFWSAAVDHSRKSDRLADCLTAARARTERNWGAGNLELPLSRLCRLDPFLWFSSHILAHLPRFHATYNEVLGEYRKVNRIRSRRHPVPDLAVNGAWFEAPFWVWREGDRIRRRLFARQDQNEIALSDGREPIGTLPLTPAKEACCAVEALRLLQDSGWRFRTRALTTTLFSRLCLADLFLHGLGGAKYDEMTDRLISRFFGLPVPDFLMLSGTVRLPITPHPVDQDDVRRLRRQLRELEFHSDRFLPVPPTGDGQTLVEEKQRLVAAQQRVSANRHGKSLDFATDADHLRDAPQGYERFRRLREVNSRLAEFTRVERDALQAELSRTVGQVAANGVLQNREYAFCLFPTDALQHFMNDVCSEIGT